MNYGRTPGDPPLRTPLDLPHQDTFLRATDVRLAGRACNGRASHASRSRTRDASPGDLRLHFDGILGEIALRRELDLPVTLEILDHGHVSYDADAYHPDDGTPIDVKARGERRWQHPSLVHARHVHRDWLYVGCITVHLHTPDCVSVTWDEGAMWGRSLCEHPERLARPGTEAHNYLLKPPGPWPAHNPWDPVAPAKPWDVTFSWPLEAWRQWHRQMKESN